MFETYSPALAQPEPQQRVLSFPPVIDSTMLSTAICPQKFYNEFCLKIAKTGISVDLHAGGAMAHALHHARLALYKNGFSLEEALMIGTHSFIKFWGDYEAPETSPKDFITVLNAFYDYFREYPPHLDRWQPYRKPGGDPAVEFSFTLPMNINHPDTGDPILFGGRADMIAQRDSLLAVMDEKTTKQLGAAWPRQWYLRGQFLGYIYAAQQTLGLDIHTAVIRGIALQKTQYGHMEVIVEHPQWQIERWWQQAHQKVAHLVEYYKRARERFNVEDFIGAHNEFPYNYGDACSAYYGCPMMDLCNSKDPSLFYSSYDVREWNPVDKNPTRESKKVPTETFSIEELME